MSVSKNAVADDQHDPGDPVPDELVPDRAVRRELGGITATTLRKWEKDPRLKFPPRIRILERTYRSRKALDEFKQGAIQRGLEVARVEARGAAADPKLRKRKKAGS